MTCDQVTAALDDLLDGRGSSAWLEAAGAHVASCAECRSLAADVRTIRAAARTLGPIDPPPLVWQRIERAVAPPTARTRVSFRSWTAWQPLAAAAAIALVVSSLVWLSARLGQPAPAARAALTVATPATHDVMQFRLAEAQYSDAIARLEEATRSAMPKALDAATSASLRANLEDIDSAIGDAREALAQQPEDELSQETLLDALGSKVALLQDTMTLLDDMGTGAEEVNQ